MLIRSLNEIMIGNLVIMRNKNEMPASEIKDFLVNLYNCKQRKEIMCCIKEVINQLLFGYFGGWG